MKVLRNNYDPNKKFRTIVCPKCLSELRITDKDIKQVEGRSALYCPCCCSHFPAMTEAETATAYYNK